MNTELIRQLTPAEKELQKRQAELAALDLDLAQRELELITFRTELLNFQIQYLKKVGPLYAELDKIEAEIAEFKAGLRPDDRRARQKAEQARAKAEDSARSAGEYERNKEEPKFKPSEQLKKLYRELAKKFHPDLAGDETERVYLEKLMSEANQAYAEGDESKLRDILENGRIIPGQQEGGIEAELARVMKKIAQVRERIQTIRIEFAELKGSSMYQLKKRVEEAAAKGLDLIKEMENFLHRQIARAMTRMTKMQTGQVAEPGRE